MLAGAALAALRERDEGGVQADVRVDRAAHDAPPHAPRSSAHPLTFVLRCAPHARHVSTSQIPPCAAMFSRRAPRTGPV